MCHRITTMWCSVHISVRHLTNILNLKNSHRSNNRKNRKISKSHFRMSSMSKRNQCNSKKRERFKCQWNRKSLRYKTKYHIKRWNRNQCMVNHLVNYLRCHLCPSKSNTPAKLEWEALLHLNYHHMRK